MTSPAPATPTTGAPAPAAGQAARTHVTLITGDRAALDTKNRGVGLQRAKGREHIPVQIRRTADHTLAVPADAARLLATGTLDQRPFGVTELNQPATRRAQENGLKVTVGRNGKPAPNHTADLSGLDGLTAGRQLSPYDRSGTVKVRAPKGTYLLNSALYVDPNGEKGTDWIAQPKLTVAKRQTLTIDARKAKPVDITVPARGAVQRLAAPGYSVKAGDTEYDNSWFLDSYKDFRTAHLGPALPAGRLFRQWDSHWTKGTGEQYDITTGGPVTRLATGDTKHYRTGEPATVNTRLGAPARGKSGSVSVVGWLPGGFSGTSVDIPQKLPATRTLHVSTAGGVSWELGFTQYGGTDKDGFPIAEAGYTLGQSSRRRSTRGCSARVWARTARSRPARRSPSRPPSRARRRAATSSR